MRNKKCTVAGTGMSLALALFAGGAAFSNAASATEYTFQHFVPSAGLMADQYKKWGEMLEKRTNGRIKIKWFWSNSMFNLTQTLTSVNSGVADFGLAAGAYFPTQLPTILPLEHAYNAADMWVGVRATSNLMLKRMPELQKEFEAAGVIWAAPYTSGTFQWHQNGDWKGPESLQGKVGRTMGGARQEWYKKLGLKPVFMSISDVYQAMERNTIWGFENTLNLSNDLKLNEVAKTMVLFNSGVVMSAYTVMNPKKFHALSKEDQKILLETGVDWGENVLARALHEKEQTVVEEWKKKGVAVVIPPAAQTAQMKKIARDAAMDMAKAQDAKLGPTGLAAKALTVLWDEVEKAEQELKAKGHPWK